MDISFKFEDKRLNYRVAAIITHDNHVLLQTHNRCDFWVLPGGRCQFGEESGTAIQRELLEELGIDFNDLKLRFVLESFFDHEDINNHELSNIFQQVLPEGTSYEDKTKEYFETEVDGSEISFKWFSVNELTEVELYPTFLKSKITEEFSGMEHIVHYGK